MVVFMIFRCLHNREMKRNNSQALYNSVRLITMSTLPTLLEVRTSQPVLRVDTGPSGVPHECSLLAGTSRSMLGESMEESKTYTTLRTDHVTIITGGIPVERCLAYIRRENTQRKRTGKNTGKKRFLLKNYCSLFVSTP